MTNHCTHEQSQAMKEIGFDMPVRDIFIYDEIKSSSKPINWNNNLTSAPTHAEALEWFREKKGIDGWATLPTVEFTEDEWNTVYRGSCIDSTFYAYLVRGDGYGTFWIPKCYVRLVNCC